MSHALYGVGGLRFWTEQEILLREQAVDRLFFAVRSALREMNRAWSFQRVEGPLLMPRRLISSAYDENDVWLQQAKIAGEEAVMRPETTQSSYAYARQLVRSATEKLPLCVWQVGKSFRRETNDGASASKLRFYEFYQMELQCIYSADSKADYASPVTEAVWGEITKLLAPRATRLVKSDRLPAYSELTMDVEVARGERFTEMCSISTRNDCPLGKVLEVAIGLDRLVSVMGEKEEF